jgi:hypothetical protein
LAADKPGSCPGRRAAFAFSQESAMQEGATVRAKHMLSDDTRAAFAGFVDNHDCGDAWALVLSALPETELAKCEQLIGLNRPDPEFREGVATAIFFSLVLHSIPLKRSSIVRREYKLIEKEAATAAKSLRQLSAALDQTVLRGMAPRLLRLTDGAFETHAAVVALPCGDCQKSRRPVQG